MSTAAAPVVIHTDFVSVPTQDLETARAFYRDVIGLEEGPVYGGGERPAVGAEFETGNLTLSVIQCDLVGMTFAASVAPIALGVADIESARATLEERGVTFAAPTMDTGVCHMAHFRDPDGNALMLHQRHAGRD